MKTNQIKQILEKIRRSEKRVISKHDSEEEEDITARLLENIERDFKELNTNISTKIFKRKGKNSEEKRFGADLLTVLEINNGNQSLKKYFLAQAKKLKSNERKYYLKHDKMLISQIRKMLSITSDSFIFVYTKNGIFVKSAMSRHNYYKCLSSFFKDFIKCFIGDIHTKSSQAPRFILNLEENNLKELSQDINILYLRLNLDE